MPHGCWRGWGSASALLLLLATPLAAQQGPARAEVERLAAAVAAADAPRPLEQELRRLRAREESETEAEALRRLHLGLLRLRLNQLGDYRGAPNGDLERATELAPDWAWAWYLRGLSKRSEGDWLAADKLNLGTRVGFGAYEAAVAHFERALSVEPAFGPALRELAETVVLLRDTARARQVLLPALARAGLSTDTLLLYTQAHAERSVGDSLRALAAAHRLVELAGPSARTLRELAWSGFVAGDAAAETAYFAGAALDDSAGVAGYREDLAFIADSVELAAFDARAGEARAAWLKGFWRDRDRASLRAEGTRLAEHYRRITEAERRFGLEVNRRYHHAWDSYRSGSTRFDDRGIVYIRHGPPDDSVSTVSFGLPPNLTWRYRLADGDMLLHFAANMGTIEYGAGGDLHDYRLVPSLWAVIRPGGTAGQTALDAMLESRCALWEPYCKFNGWGPFGQRQIFRDEEQLVAGSTWAATATDGAELRFPRLLAGGAALFAVGSEGGRPMVHAVWQVFMTRPAGADSTSGLRTRATVRFALFDSTGASAGFVDTTVVLATTSRADTVVVPGRVAVPVPPGRYRYRLAISTDDSTGRVYPLDSVPVRPTDGRTLAVSDLVLGRRDVSVAWSPAPGDTAYFTPGARWRATDTLELYHEIYGLAEGERYRAKLTVRRGRRALLTLGWEGDGAAGVTRVARELDFSRLKPGDYVMELEVTSRGRKALASRRLGIRE